MSIKLTREEGKGKKMPLLVKMSAKGLPAGDSVVGVWRQDTNEIVGHSDVVSGTDPVYTSECVLDHFTGEDLDVKFCVYAVESGNVSNFLGCKEASLKTLLGSKKNPEHAIENGATLSLVTSVFGVAPKEKKEPKPQQKKMTAEEKAREKLVKAAIKEGGKKGQDLCGMSTFGVYHFCPSVDSPGDDWELFQHCMDGMNKEVDPDADDRKGGAGDLAKILFCASDAKLMMYCHVPEERKENTDLEDWFNRVAESVGAKVFDVTSNFAKAEILADADNNLFPLKLRDVAIGTSFAYLKEKALVLDDDSDDEINFADECGVDLNAGAEGSDY